MASEIYNDTGDVVFYPLHWKSALDCERFTKGNELFMTPGVSREGDTLIEKVTDGSVKVNPFKVFVKNLNVTYLNSVTQVNDTEDLITGIDIQTEKTIAVDYTVPYIVLEFLYTQTKTPVPTLKSIAYADYDSSKQVLLGKCLFRDNISTLDEMYGIDIRNVREMTSTYKAEKFFTDFNVTVIGDYGLQVAGGYLEGNVVSPITITYGQGTGADFDLDIPAAGYHRYDLVYVDNYNVIQVREGEEETYTSYSDTPDKISLYNYEFPLAYIYVSDQLSTRTIEPADVDNITLRFQRKGTLQGMSPYNVIITDQIECDAYFGTNVLDDQGGTTPGLYDDGFAVNSDTSIARSGIKTVMINGRSVYFKNQYDTNGNPIPYNIYNQVILDNGSQILREANVSFYLYNSYSGFKVRNETDIEVLEYSADTVGLAAYDFFYKDITQDNYGSPINPTDYNVLNIFSETGTLNREALIDSVVVSVSTNITVNDSPGVDWTYDNIDIRDISNNNISTTDFASTEYQVPSEEIYRIMTAYINASSKVEVRGYKFNLTTKIFDETYCFALSDTGTWSDVRIAANSERIIVVASNGAGSLQLFKVETSDADDGLTFADFNNDPDGEQIENSNGITSYLSNYNIFLHEDNSFHVIGVSSVSTFSKLTGIPETTPSENSDYQSFTIITGNFSTTSGNMRCGFYVEKISTNVYDFSCTVQYNFMAGLGEGIELIYYKGLTSSFVYSSTIYVYLSSSTCFSKIVKHRNGYIAITASSDPNSVYRHTFTDSAVTFPTFVYDASCTSLDVVSAISPKFSTEGILIITLWPTSGIGNTSIVLISEDGVTYTPYDMQLPADEYTGHIASVSQGYLITAYSNPDVSNECYLLKTPIIFSIVIGSQTGYFNPLDPLGETDLIVSFDYCTNINTDIHVDTTVASSTPLITVANCINSVHKIRSYSIDRPTIEGSDKTYGLSFPDLMINTYSNDFGSVSGLRYSSLSNISVDGDIEDCTNIITIGMYKGDMIIYSGDY